MKQRALDIDALLWRHRSLWQLPAYHKRAAPYWPDNYPGLADHLLALSDTQVAALAADDHALLHYLAPVLSDSEALLRCIALPRRPALQAQEPPVGIPGRKWQQILAFCGALPAEPASPQSAVVDWCAGKGYLTGALHERLGVAAAGLEIDRTLVRDGNRRLPPGARLIQCDVLSDGVGQHLKPGQHLAALHACGGLHHQLLAQAVTSQASQLSLSPCCYHRYIEQWVTLSNALQQSPLTLRREDLRLAVRQTATARRGEQQARRTLQAWQLGFRQVLFDSGATVPDRLPGLPQPLAKRDFATFSRTLAERAGLPQPAIHSHHEDKGWQLLARTERLELAAMAFRRALELRCVLDAALFLEEHGFNCEIEEFCPPTLTPRNILLRAYR